MPRLRPTSDVPLTVEPEAGDVTVTIRPRSAAAAVFAARAPCGAIQLHTTTASGLRRGAILFFTGTALTAS